VLTRAASRLGNAPDFVEVSEAGIAVDHVCDVSVRFNVLGDEVLGSVSDKRILLFALAMAFICEANRRLWLRCREANFSWVCRLSQGRVSIGLNCHQAQAIRDTYYRGK
jgi:hypothetical protein